jgi:ribosome-associated protein
MEDLSLSEIRAAARELGILLAEHKGADVAVLDLSGLNSWTDCFVIATVSSSVHLKGLQRHVKEFAGQRSIEILRRNRKASADDEWNLIDLGFIVVHLMTSKSRAFYELERLWSGSDYIWRSDS